MRNALKLPVSWRVRQIPGCHRPQLTRHLGLFTRSWMMTTNSVNIEVKVKKWRRQDFVTRGGSEVWIYRGSRVRSPPEADTLTAVHREFVGFGTV